MAKRYSTKPTCLLALSSVKIDDRGLVDTLFNSTLGPAVQDAGFTAVRLDRLWSAEILASRLQKAINAGDVFVAVLSDLDPFISYQLGLATGMKKPAILILEEGISIQPDIAGTQVLFFTKGNTQSLIRLRNNLFAMLSNIIRQYDFETLRQSKVDQPSFGPDTQRAIIEANEAVNDQRLDDALEILTKQAKDLEQRNGQRSTIVILNRIAQVYQQLGDFHSAFDTLAKILPMMPDASLSEEGATCVNVAVTLQGLGDNEGASEFYHRALIITELSGDRHTHAVALSNLGYFLHRKGDLGSADQVYERSILEFETLEDEHSAALARANLAAVRQANGELDSSEELLRSAAQTMERHRDRAGLARVWHNLASIHMKRRDYLKAEELLERSLKEKVRARDRAGASASLYNLAVVNAMQGRYETSLNLLQQVLSLQERIGDRRGQINALRMISEISETAGNPEIAADFLRKALEVSQEISSPDQDDIRQKLAALSGEREFQAQS
jgi:tetratricopeptide (TPR) repeat protein